MKSLRSLICLVLVVSLFTPTAMAFHVPPWDTGHNSFSGDDGDDDTDPGDDCPCKKGSPVEVASGNFDYNTRDLLVAGLGPDIDLSRTYNSRDMRKGPFGNGWVFSYDERITETTDGTQVFGISSNANGKREVFTRLDDGTYRPPAYAHSSLVKHNDRSFTLAETTGTVRRFDSDGKLTAVTDRNGNTLTLSYDSTGFPLSITDATGRAVQFTKGANGRVESFTDPANRTSRYAYDDAGNLTRFTDPLGNSTNYQYDSKNNLTAVLDPRGNRSAGATYDSENRVSVLFDGAETWTYIYQPALKRTTKRDSANRVWTYEYGDAGNITKRTDPTGKSELYTFDGNFNLTQATNQNGQKTSFTYDAAGNILSVTDALGNARTQTYEPVFNLPLTSKDQLGNTTRFEYDAHGNLTRRVNPLGDSTQFQYDSKGQLVKEIDSAGGTTTYAYDAFGNLTKTTNPLGDSDTATFDVIGRMSSQTDQEGHTTQFVYDDDDRLLRITNPQGGVTTNDYDAADNLVATTLPNGKRTTYEYDAFNRVTRVTDPSGQSTAYTYDRRNNVTSKTNPAGQVITYSYDALERLVTEQRPDDTVSYTYDSVGNTLTVIDNDSRLAFSYDALNRVMEAQTGPASNQPTTTIRYTYDAAGRRKTMTDPSGGVTTYAYDVRSLVTSISAPSGVQADFEYDKLQRRTRMTRSGGATTQYTYNAAHRLLSVAHQSAAGALSFNYSYDRVGNRLSLDDADGSHSYTYDLLYQLSGASHPQGGQSGEAYSYDLGRNRVTSHLSATNNFDDANRLRADARFDYAYDANGNLVQKTERANGSTTKFLFDSANQLQRVDLPNGTFVSFRYDGLGRRVERNVNGQVTRYAYDAWDIVAEFSADAQVVASYIHGPEVDEVLAARRGATTSLLEADALKSVARVVTGGSVSAAYKYDSFGRVVSQSGAATTPYAFQGREFDPVTGLYYFRSRYYDPETGRFLSEDPLRFSGGENFYAFVANSPVNFSDPSGMSPSFGDCLARCSLDQFGLQSLLGAAGVGAGQPLLSKPFVTEGASEGTSIASKYLSRWLPQRLPTRIWTPTLKNPRTFTPVLGRALGRWVPILGWGLLAYDAVSIGICVDKCMNEETCNTTKK